MRSINRIVKVNECYDYKMSLLFNNGESRIIDFKHLFEKWKINENHIAYSLINDINEFNKFKLIDGTIVWENINFKSIDDEGKEIIQHFDLDPIILYENSAVDSKRSLKIGMKIRKVRRELGLSQAALARKSGTTKHYISRIENERSGIELMTLKKLVEALGKKLQININ